MGGCAIAIIFILLLIMFWGKLWALWVVYWKPITVVVSIIYLLILAALCARI